MADKKKIALLGAGTMGIGIAQMFAQAGHQVKLIYVYDDKVRARPRETMEANLNILREEGVQDGGAIPAILDRVSWTESLEEAAAFADVVIECIVEGSGSQTGLLSEAGRPLPPLDGPDHQYVRHQRDGDCREGRP